MRFEAPNESNRWDCPLFKVSVCPPGSSPDDFTAIVEETRSLNLSNAAPLSAETPDASASAVKIVDAQESTPAAGPLIAADTISAGAQTKSSFTSSWKPKKKTVSAATKSPSSAADDDAASVLTFATKASSATMPTAAVSQAGTNKGVCFTGTMVVQEDSVLVGFKTLEETLQDISNYFNNAVAAAPNSSTISAQRANPDLLYELDRTSQKIIQFIVAHQAEGQVEGTPLKFIEYDRQLTLNRHAGLAELQRYRRQYVKINGQHPPTTATAIGSAFIDFLALHI
jgi:tRNA uridine 5-carbamoylmethylation protein Kti12